MSSRRKWWSRRPAARTLVEQTEVMAVRDVAPRRATVYLPPHYDANRARAYPLLIALDGQTMPQWRLAETLDELVSAGR